MVGSAQFFKVLPALGALLLFAVSEAGLIISMVERDTKTLNDGTRTYEAARLLTSIALTAASCVGATVCALALIALALFLFLAGLHSSKFRLRRRSVFCVGISLCCSPPPATSTTLNRSSSGCSTTSSPPMQSLITAAQILASVLVPVAGPICSASSSSATLPRQLRIATYFQLGPAQQHQPRDGLLYGISILLLFWTLSRQAAIQDRTIIGAIFRVLAYVNVRSRRSTC